MTKNVSIVSKKPTICIILRHWFCKSDVSAMTLPVIFLWSIKKAAIGLYGYDQYDLMGGMTFRFQEMS